jgi:hypothetical protein
MDRPAFPALVSLVYVPGGRPQVVPMRGMPDLYAIAVPAGYPAYIVSPDGQGAATHTRGDIESMLEQAAKHGHDGLSYGIWTVRVTRGAWKYLGVIKELLADILGVNGFLPMEPGVATVGDRARVFARACVRRLFAPPAQPSASVPTLTIDSTAGKLLAPRPSYPIVPAGPTGNGELRNASTETQRATATNPEVEPPQGEA